MIVERGLVFMRYIPPSEDNELDITTKHIFIKHKIDKIVEHGNKIVLDFAGSSVFSVFLKTK